MPRWIPLLCALMAALAGCDEPADDRPDAAPEDTTEAGDTAVMDASGDGDGADAPDFGEPEPAVTLEAAGATLHVDPAARQLTLGDASGEALLVFDAGALELGVVDAIEDDVLYSPWGFKSENRIFHPAPRIRGWSGLRHIDVVDAEATPLELELHFEEGHRARLRVTPGERRFQLTITPEPAAESAVAFIRMRPQVHEDERFYGLGEVFDSVEHRGRVRAMQLEADTLESANNEAHVPVPLLLSTRGWGLFVASYEGGLFDVAASDPERLDVIFAQAASDALELHLFTADEPLDLTRTYYALTGFPVMPARWALGPWIWRDENDDAAQVLSDAAAIRDLDLATTAYWIDRPYASAVNTFDFASNFPEPRVMIDGLHDAGLRVALWHTPYIDAEAEAAAGLRAEAESAGYFPPTTGLLLNNWSEPLDLTDPDAYAWWQQKIRVYTEMGVEGFKLDYGEDIAVGAAGLRNTWRFDDGSSERTMHARYQLFYHRVYAETLPETGGFLLCRGGTWGDQRSASVIWPGDLAADFSRQGDPFDDDGTTRYSVGGVPAALIAGLSLGPSGFPLYGSDTGGYRHAPPDKETFMRWFQITALSPVMQVGTNSNDVPWELGGENGFDQELLDTYRVYARLHLRLWPYVWTHLERLQSDGRPIQRPTGLAYPELGVHPSDTFLLGAHLFAAPVVERDARTRTFTMPPGDWYDWWDDTRVGGAQEHTVDAPLTRLPLYQQAGTVVPLLRPTIDAIAPVADASAIDSLATDTGHLWARVAMAPGDTLAARQSASFELYDGAQLVFVNDTASTGHIGYRFTPGSEFTAGAVFEVVGLSAAEIPEQIRFSSGLLASSASIEALLSADEGWLRDADTGRLYIKVTDEGAAWLVEP